MKKLVIAFDVDDTLIVPSIVTGLPTDTPNYENIAIYRWFQAQGHTMVIWSGGGISYAQMWADKLGLKPYHVWRKEKNRQVDICFDDCEVDLAAMNIQVSRIKNSINRKEWNEHKAE